ncbi:MAG: hypothetical protein JSR09_05845 [Bacteroidetes bacterium]|nr:hypothetical protein [Bacteroidota bacterium]
MFKSLLFPNKFKKIGWFILVPSFILGLCLIVSGYEPSFLNGRIISIFPSLLNQNYFAPIKVNFSNTIVGVLFIVGAMFVGFSREKNEDEFISKVRLSSLLWAVFVNYLLLLIAFIFIYETAFLSVMIYNMFTVLIIFIVRFNFILFRNSKNLSNAE